MSRQCSTSPTLDLQLNLSPPNACPNQNEPPNILPSSWEFSSEDHESSCVSSEAEENSSFVNYSSSCSDEIMSSMVVVGCPRCLMYVMLSEVDPKCPKCKSSVLLNFFAGENAKKVKESWSSS